LTEVLPAANVNRDENFFTPIFGFVLVASIAFGYFGWNFTHAYSEGFTTIVTQVAIALAIVGLIIGSIAHHRWKMAFLVSVTPLVGVTALAVGGRNRAQLSAESPAILGDCVLMLVFSISFFGAAWLSFKIKPDRTLQAQRWFFRSEGIARNFNSTPDRPGPRRGGGMTIFFLAKAWPPFH
jgi:hypothetical protein